jgi:hypothetical protein
MTRAVFPVAFLTFMVRIHGLVSAQRVLQRDSGEKMNFTATASNGRQRVQGRRYK